MVSEFINAAQLYPWNRPPEEVYHLNPIRSVPGISFDIKTEIASTFIEASIYALAGEFKYSNKRTEITGELEEGLGTAISIERGDFQFRVSYTYAYIDAEIFVPSRDRFIPGTAGNASGLVTDYDLRSTNFTSVGLKYDNARVLFMSEFAKINAKSDFFLSESAYYATLGVYLADQKFLLHATYATSYDKELNTDNAAVNAAVTANQLGTADHISNKFGANWNISPTTTLKLEAQRFKAEGGNLVTTFAGGPNRQFPDWAWLYGLSLNTVF